jgi:hypothetical protein
MPIYSYYIEKGLVYITIIAPFSCQSSFYFKYTKSNIHLSYNVKLISKDKYICPLAYLITYYSL